MGMFSLCARVCLTEWIWIDLEKRKKNARTHRHVPTTLQIYCTSDTIITAFALAPEGCLTQVIFSCDGLQHIILRKFIRVKAHNSGRIAFERFGRERVHLEEGAPRHRSIAV
mmetsp:Transcript_39612/g.63884  ORF Transcript_39612/g.63884 Transcript_39612/m.63884 type:complete len:112 (+) Transcript_39612:868-1203(+)